jgi:pimeloyl-ACP methyl ester carboxylesterase
MVSSSFVLVHGGCHGGWCWEPVVGRLANRGHDAVAIDLPGRGQTADLLTTVTLDDWTEAIATAVAIASAVSRPLLVAHSLGGVPGSAFAGRHPDAIAGVIYVNAVVPTDGEAGLPLLQAGLGPTSPLVGENAIRMSPDGKSVTVAPEVAREAFYTACPVKIADAAISRLCPEPLTPLVTPVALGPQFATVPKTYIAATDDRAVPPAFARRMADRANADHRTISADHSPFLSTPDTLADMLEELAVPQQRPFRAKPGRRAS